jgi:hypothetical protein
LRETTRAERNPTAVDPVAGTEEVVAAGVQAEGRLQSPADRGMRSAALKESGMKDSWCLATSRIDLGAKSVVELYGKRFTIEENFRDTKDQKFGLGLSSTHIGTPARRDRLLLVAAIAQALLTLLGAAGEALGMDRLLKANTVKKRTHSLYRQGLYYYNAIPKMREARLIPLAEKFAEFVRAQAICVEIFGII